MDQARSIKLLLILSLLIAFSGIWDRAFSTRGEGREAIVAQSILSSGDWILPSGYGGSIPSKPPAMHWGIALLSLPIGDVNEFTARLPSAIAMVSFVCLFFLFFKGRGQERVGFLASLILLTSFEWFRAGIGCRVDMLLSATFAGGLITLFTWQERGLVGVPWSSIALLSIATLCKGPVAIVLPAAIFGVYACTKGDSVSRVVLSLMKVFLPVFVIGGLWYVAAYFDGQQRFVDKIYYENVARFLGTMEDEPHKHSVFYLLGMIPIGLAPWTFIIIPFLFLRNVRAKIISTLKAWRRVSPFVLFSLITVTICTGFFSIPSSKRSVYLLPIFPFLSFLLARTFLHLEGEVEAVARRVVKILVYLFGSLAVIGLTIGVLLHFVGSHFLDGIFPGSGDWSIWRSDLERLVGSWGWFDAVWALLFLLALLMVMTGKVVSETDMKWCYRFGISVALCIGLVSWCLIRPLNNEISSKTLLGTIPPEALKSRELLAYKNSFYGLSFYLRRELRTATEGFTNGATVFMYEDLLDTFSSQLAQGQKAKVIFTSPSGIEHFSRRLVIAQVSP